MRKSQRDFQSKFFQSVRRQYFYPELKRCPRYACRLAVPTRSPHHDGTSLIRCLAASY